MIYEAASARRLALVRIAVFAIWIVDLVREPLHELAALPIGWFAPHGPWILLPSAALAAIWNAPVLLALEGAALLCAGLALVGAPGARGWAASAAALITFATGFVRGFGHADHSQLQLLFATFVLLFLPAWDALAWRTGAGRAADDPAYRAGFAALALVFSFPYFLTAVYRLTHEGAALFFADSMRHFIARDTLMLDHFDFTLGLDLLEHAAIDPVLGIGFALVTAAELASPWVFLRRSWSVVWLAVIVPFHLLAPVIMHVLFAHNMALIALLYVWPLGWRSRG